MTLWRWILEFAALATMLMVVLACGAFLQIAMTPDARIEALKNAAYQHDCVVAFRARWEAKKK